MVEETATGGFGHGGPNGGAGHGDPGGYQLELRHLEESILLARYQFARRHGMSFNGNRDEYQVLGYPDVLTYSDFREEYRRGGIAGRIVDVMPDATWRGEPAMELVEDEDPKKDTEFEKAWKELDTKHQICAKLRRVDKLSRLSTYAVLLIGAGKGDEAKLDSELPKAKSPADLLYLMPFSGGGGPGGSNNRITTMDADCSIAEFEMDPQSPRFGLPKYYRFKRADVSSPAFQVPVHYTRVVHIAEDLLDDEVYGQPALERVWNLLLDLRKVTGGGAEAFWLRANQGLHLNVDKDMSLPDATHSIEQLKAQAEEYKHQMTRWLRTRGVDIKTLGSDVANFEGPADALLTQIAGAKAIPKRILTGSEMGELASSQDRENFRDQIVGRQSQYAGPYIVRPLIDRLIQYGYLPAPRKGPQTYNVRWPHMQVLTEDERSKGAVSWSQTAVAGNPVFTDAEIRDKWYGMPPLTDEQREELAKRKEEAAPPAPPMPVPPEDEEEELLAAEQRKFSSTQVQLPPVLASALLSLGKSIPPADLCDEEGGVEDDAHITVKYGLHANDAAELRKALATYVGPIRFALGKTNIFEAANYDVLYVEVNSPDLIALNRWISDRVEVTDTYPTYVPHATVAYLKRGLGAKYVGMNNLEGMSASVGMLRFSPAEGEDVDLRITGRREDGVFAAAEAGDEELIRVLADALESGNTDVVMEIIGLA